MKGRLKSILCMIFLISCVCIGTVKHMDCCFRWGHIPLSGVTMHIHNCLEGNQTK